MYQNFVIPCFNDTEDISYLLEQIRKTSFDSIETNIITAAYVCISVAGVFGNGLVCLAVAKSSKMRTTRNILIANMSLANFLFALIIVPFMWLPKMRKIWNFGSLICKQVNVVASTNLFCSSFTIIACAADRYLAVSSRRSSSHHSSSISNTIGLIMGIWLLSILISSPFWIFYDVVITDLSAACRPDIILSTVCDLVLPRPLEYALSSFQLFCLVPLPIGCLAVFNYKLTTFLPARRASSVRKTRTFDAKQSRVTILLVSMTASYALLWIPFSILVLIGDIYSDLLLEYDRNGRVFERIQVALHILSSLSVCVNPVLYGFLNSNFRRAFIEIWRCVIRRDTSEFQTEIMTTRRRFQESVRFQGRRKISISLRRLTDNEENCEEDEDQFQDIHPVADQLNIKALSL